MRVSLLLRRRGKPRPRAGMFPEKYRRVPALLKPQQGGQQYFSEFLIRSTNDRLTRRDEAKEAGTQESTIAARLPQMDWEQMSARSSADAIRGEMRRLAEADAAVSQRVFNERVWYDEEEERRRLASDGAMLKPKSIDTRAPQTTDGELAAKRGEEVNAIEDQQDVGEPNGGLPPRVLGGDYFQSCFGYSLLKSSEMPHGAVDYNQLDLWGEMPKYTRDMVFLYLVSRRRNTYAVAFTYEGRRILQTYTAGNRGLKGGDRGFRADGSTDNGHQVTSMYLNDLLPRLREMRASEGRPLGRNEKIELVVRVMGFYNGRQGAVRAVQDRATEFHVRYFEDITPFPLNGPKMPRGVFK